MEATLQRPQWWLICFSGVVQGVGFRPTVWRTANAARLRGRVWNTTDGAHVAVECTLHQLQQLVEDIRRALPPIARIDSVTWSTITAPRPEPRDFTIDTSQASAEHPTDVSPDVAICPDCLADIRRQPRRRGYLLTNCTNCGPRFSIVRRLPYDRPATSMGSFEMCDDCRAEYTSPADRRFHAQPISCNNCGPHYRAVMSGGEELTDARTILELTAGELRQGHIVMIKGVGGYNLLCDATCRRAVESLRSLKQRPRKPFVVMFGDLATANRVAEADSPTAATLLQSWRAPVVVLPARPAAWQSLSPLIGPVTTLLPRTIGIILPHMAMQHALFDATGLLALVFTSANSPGLPIITDDDDALDYASSH